MGGRMNTTVWAHTDMSQREKLHVQFTGPLDPPAGVAGEQRDLVIRASRNPSESQLETPMRRAASYSQRWHSLDLLPDCGAPSTH